ncbi:MAG: carboxypeptidase regulatory-like domain-containing protein [Acidobacteria bacterium]|nr:carboxypeptidase regulatory-like domain-containing protein [Acidobacteriota bacterium]
MKRAFLLLLVVAGVMCAQFTTASLGGTVRDSTGAVVPDARLTIRNTETGFVQNVGTDATGSFLFYRLPVGSYELRVEKAGFTAYVQSGIQLTVDRMATQNVTLQVGAVSEQVTVQAEAELIQTRTAAAGQLVDEKRIVELPLNGRRPERLVYLAAGTIDLGRNSCQICGHGGVYPGEETAGVNGAGIYQVNFQLDGTSHNDTYINVSLPFPNPDSVQEFNLQASNFTAEYGNAGGGIVNIITRSGTNDIHGSAFHFLRNGRLNARQFFAPKQDALKRNQFGGSLGGPILKDKLFYFGTYQGTRLRNTPAGIISFVPTPEERNGDFSSLLPGRQLIDPVSRAAVLGNRIPATRINPVSKYFLNKIPLPNAGGRQVTFPGTPIIQTENQFMIKSDYTSGKHQISGRYYFTDFDAPPFVGPQNILASTTAGNAVRVQNISLNHTWMLSPTLLVNSTFGVNRQRGGSLSSAAFGFADAGVKVLGPEHVKKLNAPPELVLSVTGGFSFSTNHLGDFDRGDFTIREVVTKIKGAHELRFGGEAVRVRNHVINTFQMAGNFTFNGQLSGDGLADFMFGRASQYRQGGGEFKFLLGTRWGFFLQDNWKVNDRLSLNLGVRWDPYLPYFDREGRVLCFQPGTTQRSVRYPNAPLGFLYGGENNDPGCPVGGSEPNWRNIGPRIGLAYRLTQDGKTSLRLGSGFYYTPIQASNYNPFANVAPFAGTFTLTDVAFEDPFGSKGQANPFPSNFGPDVPGPQFVFAPLNDVRAYFAKDYQIPRLITWTARLERQLGKDWVASVAYLGNKGAFLQLGIAENPAIFRPGATVGNTQDRRVYPNFGPVTRNDGSGNSSYHSLQWNLEKRFGRGFSILANYTWSKNIDDVSAVNPFNRTVSRGLSNFDVPHNFKFSNLWDLPKLPVSPALGKLLNGWQVNSILVRQSGFPFTVSSGVDNSFSGVGSDRADYLGGNARLSDSRSLNDKLLQWFDTSRFVANAPGTFGNSGRGILRGPGFFNADLGVLKQTGITERVSVQFRAEFFNVFNHPNFRLPASNISSSQRGRITAVIDENQRILQFGLKLLF